VRVHVRSVDASSAKPLGTGVLELTFNEPMDPTSINLTLIDLRLTRAGFDNISITLSDQEYVESYLLRANGRKADVVVFGPDLLV
jgi:hypothetical protein